MEEAGSSEDQKSQYFRRPHARREYPTTAVDFIQGKKQAHGTSAHRLGLVSSSQLQHLKSDLLRRGEKLKKKKKRQILTPNRHATHHITDWKPSIRCPRRQDPRYGTISISVRPAHVIPCYYIRPEVQLVVIFAFHEYSIGLFDTVQAQNRYNFWCEFTHDKMSWLIT